MKKELKRLLFLFLIQLFCITLRIENKSGRRSLVFEAHAELIHTIDVGN